MMEAQMEELLAHAERRARAFHRDQKYGEKEYAAHLEDVVQLLKGYGYAQDGVLLAAGWLHDSIEDGKIDVVQLGSEFGPDVARLVWAVTGTGPNRKARVADATEKTAFAGDRATVLKLCDRLANVLSCWETRDTRLFMYQREYRAFREKLYFQGSHPRAFELWKKLDDLLGWYGPKGGA